jgi:SAM-dependent methyltransferase
MSTSTFVASDGAAYERFMGRWTDRLAEPFLAFAKIGPETLSGGHLLDVGCGTGRLTFAAARRAPQLAKLVGVDLSESFLTYAKARSTDGRISFESGDACRLTYPDTTFDRVISSLALDLIPEPEPAAAEMRRVTKPGGVVAATIWHLRGGVGAIMMCFYIAAALDPAAGASRRDACASPLERPGGLSALWRSVGLEAVEEVPITIQMQCADFADYWPSFTGGQGRLGSYVAGLPHERRARLQDEVRQAYCAGDKDGPRSFSATAWAVRGLVAT